MRTNKLTTREQRSLHPFTEAIEKAIVKSKLPPIPKRTWQRHKAGQHVPNCYYCEHPAKPAPQFTPGPRRKVKRSRAQMKALLEQIAYQAQVTFEQNLKLKAQLNQEPSLDHPILKPTLQQIAEVNK